MVVCRRSRWRDQTSCLTGLSLPRLLELQLNSKWLAVRLGRTRERPRKRQFPSHRAGLHFPVGQIHGHLESRMKNHEHYPCRAIPEYGSHCRGALPGRKGIPRLKGNAARSLWR